MRPCFLAIPALFLAACTTAPTAYAPAAPGEMGYRDSRIEDDRFRVSFTGGPDAGPARNEDLALRRAAEVTLESGYDWFEVIGRDRDSRGDRERPVSVGGSLGQSFGGRGYRGSSVGLGVSFNSSRVRRDTVTLDILAGRGPRPDGPAFYDARDVVVNIPAD